MTYLTRLKQTASIGLRIANILRWISGGIARKGTLFLKAFHASSCAPASRVFAVCARALMRLVATILFVFAVVREEDMLIVGGEYIWFGVLLL